jgi:hypothetical protein
MTRTADADLSLYDVSRATVSGQSELCHYSYEPFRLNPHHEYTLEPHAMKPTGLWVSVDNAWQQWCEGENFAIERLRHCTAIYVTHEARILQLTSPKEIDIFTRVFHRPNRSPYSQIAEIDWPRLRDHYDGLIITPHQWDRRWDPRTLWYSLWDCASGCIWNCQMIHT